MIRNTLVQVTACVLFAVSSTATGQSVNVSPVNELILRFNDRGGPRINPALAIDAVNSIARGRGGDRALFLRLGSPTSARWLIRFRLPPHYIDALKSHFPRHPEIYLQQYVVLGYASQQIELTAYSLLKSDAAVATVSQNSAIQYSTLVNDYFVSATTPTQIPAGYQWALETLRAMSPYANPAQTAGWDQARGFGYIGVVDSGIDPGHPDLQQNFRPHFSQAFYSGSCSDPNLTDVDERGTTSTCPNTMVGHGTHVAGLIGGTPNNSIGVAGMCWTCSLIIAKAYSNDGAGGLPSGLTADVVNGIYHSIISGAQLINRSGGTQNYLTQYGVGVNECAQLPSGTDGYCDALSLAELRQVVVVAAAGNENNRKLTPESRYATEFPATEPLVVSVGGTIYGDALWSDDTLPGLSLPQGTNLDKLNFVAPAKQVVSTFYRGGTWFYPEWCSDSVNNSVYAEGYGYDECTGTSMATPLVTGAIAIARSINPLLSRAEIVSQVDVTSRIVAGFKMPDVLAANISVSNTNSSVTPAFSLLAVGNGSTDTRLFTVAPQMGTAAIKGTMLPLPNQSTELVPYSTDANAPSTGFVFPDTVPISIGTAYFGVFTRFEVGGQPMLPLYRLSKLQDAGGGLDECGFPNPSPSKKYPIQHIYTANESEKAQLESSTSGNCFQFDGVEGYLSAFNTGGLELLYRLYSPGNDSYILVPERYLSLAYSLGYSSNQTSMGYVVPY